MLWQIDITPKVHASEATPDRAGARVEQEAAELFPGLRPTVVTSRGYVLRGGLDRNQADRLARTILSDAIVERVAVTDLTDGPSGQETGPQIPVSTTRAFVLYKPGVTDPTAETTASLLADLGAAVDACRTYRRYDISGVDRATAEKLTRRLLANDSIEEVHWGGLPTPVFREVKPYPFERKIVPIMSASSEELERISREGQLSLTPTEFGTIREHFRSISREPTDAELETIAQTWSEHCSHKTLKGRIKFTDGQHVRQYENLLKETIFAATQELRKKWGDNDWCVSVFRDNAGIVTFTDEWHICFKVETHNRPSAIEPYGGANTGLGGVIRDTLGTGLGAKPIASTDVFAFAPPDMATADLPTGVLHPRRVMQGVVSGVRDYGNRMGIPTVAGGVIFDERYLGNPLVFCGNVGVLPIDAAFGDAAPGDRIVALGGRTGRDGIHGATFSSVELTSQSETLSGGAVQIGHAIHEKMLADVLLTARDRRLYRAVTDCGAGGFSSAVGEMGADIGAAVELTLAPLKYDGLSYREIWISESQERMVLAVPPEHLDELIALAASEGVEAVDLGVFEPTGRLKLTWHGEIVADLDMHFLHEGMPKIVRDASYIEMAEIIPAQTPSPRGGRYDDILLRCLSDYDVCSKEWIVRQYDHEVLAGTALRSLVGAADDGPGDAAVIRPILGERRGVVLSHGLCPRYGDLDPYHMATCAIDEAVRNAVSVGADPSRIALLDNFCWGRVDRPETLGSLVRAAEACRDVALAWETPFVSGKDSLNNEFRAETASGARQIVIPGTLLISAMGQMADVGQAVSSDFKRAGNKIVLVGHTAPELGGSLYHRLLGIEGGRVPRVRLESARLLFQKMHAAILAGCVTASHDLSEGGLAVAVAEMAIGGRLGAAVSLDDVHSSLAEGDLIAEERRMLDATGIVATLLFSESPSRFLVEIAPERLAEFQQILSDVPTKVIGEVTTDPRLTIDAGLSLLNRLTEAERTLLAHPELLASLEHGLNLGGVTSGNTLPPTGFQPTHPPGESSRTIHDSLSPSEFEPTKTAGADEPGTAPDQARPTTDIHRLIDAAVTDLVSAWKRPLAW